MNALTCKLRNSTNFISLSKFTLDKLMLIIKLVCSRISALLNIFEIHMAIHFRTLTNQELLNPKASQLIPTTFLRNHIMKN